MTTGACAGEPLSWLVLERHALGELSPAEAARVRAHLASCAACATCAVEAARPLPLIAVAGAPLMASGAARPAWWRRYAVAWATTAALACAAGGNLWRARVPEHSPAGAIGDTLPGVKGGDVALALVRERDGAITHGAETFAPDDRWKALGTCPAGGIVFWDLSVRDGDGGRVRFPLQPAGPIRCGNRVALPGAFRLSGAGRAEVCLTLAADPLPRDPSQTKPPGAGRTNCVSLRPAN